MRRSGVCPEDPVLVELGGHLLCWAQMSWAYGDSPLHRAHSHLLTRWHRTTPYQVDSEEARLREAKCLAQGHTAGHSEDRT